MGPREEINPMSSGKMNVIVKYKNKQGMNEVSVMSSNVYEMVAKQNVMAMELTKAEIETLMQNENIEAVEPDTTLYALELLRSRELAEDEPYGISMVLEDVLWWEQKFASTPPEGSSKVCVVDTGYGNGHEDLPALDQNTDGFNPQSSGEWYIDGHSHGTHCAGTIGAVGNNSKGVVGVIPGSLNDKFSFFIGKGLSDSGSGSTSSVMAAVQACVDNGSNVISMSLGGGSPSNTVNQQYYGHYKNDDVLIIAAAGNGGNSALSYPASYESVMSVAAVDSSENKAGFSQYNEQTEISGPGVSVKSTVTGNSGSTFSYASYSGTSMATPHVAGVAGLLRMYFPDCKAFQIRNAMIITAKDKGDTGCDVNYGHGIVQAKAAFEYLEANQCDPNEAFKEPEGGCAEFSCTEDSDCDDGNPNTIDTCASGSCQHVCANDAACDDEDPCTADTCDNGVCSSVVDCSLCGGGVGSVLELTTDNYPGETSWDIKDSSGNQKYDGSGYSDANTLHTLNMCLETDEYTFNIADTYGDGICCSYGSGGYKIKVNGEEVVSGGEFGDSETETFTVTFSCTEDSDCDDGDPDTIDTCANGSCQHACGSDAACDDEDPCTADTCDNGVCSNVLDCALCGGGESSVLELTTDNYPGETSWDIKDSSGNQKYDGAGYSDKNTLYTIDMCLLPDEYTFTIEDTSGNGICCSYGSGGYKIMVNGKEVVSGGEFGDSKTETFTVTAPCIECTNNPTNYMIYSGKKTCETADNLTSRCNTRPKWVNNKYCQLSCYEAGVGYSGDVCCQSQS